MPGLSPAAAIADASLICELFGQQLRERFPRMGFPTRRPRFRPAIGKAGMVEDDRTAGTLIRQFKLRDGEYIPTGASNCCRTSELSKPGEWATGLRASNS
jgi:hypothetical protein